MIPFLATYLPRFFGRWFPDLLWRVPTSKRVLYLTFDDGPTPSMTRILLHLLSQHDAKATFFLVGEQAARHPQLVQDIFQEGHTIGNHTYTHPDAWRTPPAQIITELEQTTSLLEDCIQQPIRWMRPPYGRFSSGMRTWCRSHEQQMTMWDVMPGDYRNGMTQDSMEKLILKATRPGSILVLHDNPKALRVTPGVLETVLPQFKAEGWEFAAL